MYYNPRKIGVLCDWHGLFQGKDEVYYINPFKVFTGLYYSHKVLSKSLIHYTQRE